MACTTILVGKKASYDGSTMIARTEDSQSGVFTPKEFLVVTPEDQPRHYQSVLSKFSIDLPDNPLRYTLKLMAHMSQMVLLLQILRKFGG